MSRRRQQNWFGLPLLWKQDEEMVALPPMGQLLFLRLITLAAGTTGEGYLTHEQCRSEYLTMSNGGRVFESLLKSRCLVVDDERSLDGVVYEIRRKSYWLGGEQSPPSIQPDQGRSPRQKRDQESSSRVKREREKEPIRSPSGSDRIGSARAAPRGDEGAAQPAPEEPAGDTLARSDAIAMAREEVRKGQEKQPASRGDAKFWKYGRSLNSVGEPSTPVILSREYE